MKDVERIAEKLTRVPVDKQMMVLAYLQGMQAQKNLDDDKKTA